MTRRQYYLALAVLVVAGLAGGVLGSWLLATRTSDVMTAHEFRLVDSQGGVRGKLFVKEAVMRDGSLLRAGMLDLSSSDEHSSTMRLHYSGLSFCDGIKPYDSLCSLGIEDWRGGPRLWLHSAHNADIEFGIDREGTYGKFSSMLGPTLVTKWQVP